MVSDLAEQQKRRWRSKKAKSLGKIQQCGAKAKSATAAEWDALEELEGGQRERKRKTQVR